MTRPLEKAIIHIGCEKTGTSAIQRFLSMNRPAIKKQGFLYPVAGGSLYGGSQTGYPAVARNEVWKSDLGKALGLNTPEAVAGYRSHLAAQLALEISRARRAHTLVLSSEHLHSRLKSEAEIEKLRLFLEPFCEFFEVVVYFRRQDRVAVSLYATHMKSGNHNPSPFLPPLDLPETYYYRYDEVFRNWAAVFGPSAIRPGIFHPGELLEGDLLKDFCARCGIPFEEKKIPEPQNISLSPEAARFLLEVNRQEAEGEFALAPLEKSLLVRELERSFPGKVFPFDRKTAVEFYGRFRANNDALGALAFPGRETPVFDDDFSEYPEGLPHCGDPYPECLRVALQMLQKDMDGSSSLIGALKR